MAREQQTESALYRQLPSVDELLRHAALAGLVERESPTAVADAARTVLARLRQEIAGGLTAARLSIALGSIGAAVERELLGSLASSLRAVINATGVVLHTNLGRAPLAQVAIEHIAETAGEYSNLEFDLDSGDRGKRDVHVQRLFARLLGPHADAPVESIVVNNCAAAVMLALNSFAEGGEVIVSRGELVEIGGSFRVPDVMAKSHAVLREVGTTNRTRISDYENAITDNTRLLLRVHRSNFAIVGFTEQPSLAELCELGRRRRIPVMEDLGNGALIDLESVGIQGESGVAASLRAGVDVVVYSGDKLLGGPQAGILTGRQDLIRQARANPLFRALRVDKLTYAALEATLLCYLRGRETDIPAVAMMRATADDIRARAERLQGNVAAPGLRAQLVAGESIVGGGTAPTATLPTTLLALTHQQRSAAELQQALRRNPPPVIARVEDGRVLLDLRTVFERDEPDLVQAIERAARG